MRSRTRLHAALAAAITLLTVAGPAAAESVIQQLSVFLARSVLEEGASRTLSFEPFDASLGTLMSAVARLNYGHTLHTTLIVDFNSPGLPYNGEGQGQATSTASLTVDGDSVFSNDVLVSPSFTNFQALGSGRRIQEAARSSADDDIRVPVGLAYRFDLQVHDVGCSASTATPGVSAACLVDGGSLFSAGVLLIYEYSPVPLPANLGLLALGLGGLGFLQRRR